MAEQVDQFNVSESMLFAKTFSIKEEQCQEQTFTEDKVVISETAITIDSAELQGSIWHGKIEKHEESVGVNNIKTEFVSFEVTGIQNDYVKLEGGISSDDIKIKYDNGLLYCEDCEAYYFDYCIKCGMLVHILNKHALNNADSRAQDDIPNNFLEIQNCFGRIGIYALRIIPEGVKLGPFTGLTTTECPWEMKGEKFVLDESKSKHLNWMQFVNRTKNTSERNLSVLQSEDHVYYQSTCPIRAGEELLVYFGEEYGNNLNKIIRLDFDTSKDIFACIYCCLGFNSMSNLAKHKTICVEDKTGSFSIEELIQCQFCKIHLDSKEYYEHHMAFCCERNARMCVLPTSPAMQATTALNKLKRCHFSIYKFEQCKYTTKYQSDLEVHTKQHYKFKLYKCGICSRRFKTRGSLMLHLKNTHAKHLKELDFKCDSCGYCTTYKSHLEEHIKTIHLKQFDYKCDSCEYRTNRKRYLRIHIKTKHLKQFDYKCDKCEFETNIKSNLESHIKAKYLKEHNFKCDTCEFGAKNRTDLKIHIKSKHLKQFDFKCDLCEYRTNKKSDLKRHVKSKHLKEFDYKCDKCEFRTNKKSDLKRHVKTKHLTKFDYKCDKCEFATNHKHYLEIHIKTKHAKEFDYKCDKCEFETNIKSNLATHIKAKHLKQHNFKCYSCEYSTIHKSYLERHVKTKHLKEFDYKCDKCQYRTNRKSHLKIHIKTKHLKQFDFKCDRCEFGTNLKSYLENHMKTKHLKEFDFKCDRCEFQTNTKSNVERHIKIKHLKYVNLENT